MGFYDYNYWKGWTTLFKNTVKNITGIDVKNGFQSSNLSGVYIILTIDAGELNIEHIGSSKNMRNRIYRNSHDVYDSLREVKIDRLDFDVYVYFLPTEKYVDCEKLLIKSLRPRLNVVHNKMKRL